MIDCLARQQAAATKRNARPAGVLALVLLMLTLAGCAGTPRLADSTEQALTRQLLLDDVPFHAQRDYQCGPASLAMVLNDAGVDVEVDTLIPQVFLPGRDGSVQPEMLATVRRHGRIPFVIDGRLEALLLELDAGHPVVVMQNLSLPAWPMWHYAVAIGFDLERNELILHSGEEPRRVESFRRFDATWARSERWAFVALPPGELPAGVRPHRAMEAISAFERLQGAETALPAWEALAERFTDNGLVFFGLGNARHATGDASAAIAAFERAVDAQPGLAVAWLNLGLARRDQGDAAGATRALEQAAALPGHWQPHARQALETREER
ncbi:PA2778 family cysteine peptidase [Halomonas sp. HK25]|uniref:PA2778 family cysteine peptidase n=1 Tax=Halomonas sp. HK25 TaxID=3394321 RepID=UPI0039FDD324